MPKLPVLIGLLALAGAAQETPPAPSPSIVKSEFIFERAPFPSAHASTIVQTRGGLVAAWFGGTRERDPDVGIWVSRSDGPQWSAPVEVANGVQPDGKRHPCWNPVLFQPSKGPLLLFYKVGPSPDTWWGMVRTSSDEGRTWSPAVKLPDGILGPIRAKPVELSGGVLLAGSSTENDGWVVHMERYSGDGSAASLGTAASWKKTGPLNTSAEFGAIQPTILAHSPTSLQILCRTRQAVIAESRVDFASFALKGFRLLARSTDKSFIPDTEIAPQSKPTPLPGTCAARARTGAAPSSPRNNSPRRYPLRGANASN